MKILKKFLCLFLCAVFSLSLFSFASCSSVTIDKVIAAVAKQKIKAISLNAGMDFAVKEGENSLSSSFDLDATMNVGKEDGDIILSSVTKENNVLMQSLYSYSFIREGETFYPDFQLSEPITDWSGVILQQGGNIFEQLETILSQYGVTVEGIFDQLQQENELLSSIQQSVKQGITEAISFYDFMDSISVENNKLVVNVNKLLHTFVSDVAKVLNTVNNDTTLEDIPRNKTVKKYLEYSLRDYKVSELQEELQAEIVALLQNNTLPDTVRTNLNALAQVKPDFFSSAYGYVVKVLCSKEFDAVVNDLYGNVFRTYFGEEFSATKTPIGQLFSDALGEGWQDKLGEAFEGVTEEQFAITAEDGQIILKDLNQQFILNDNSTVQAVSFGGTFTMKQGTSNEMTIGLAYQTGYSAQEKELTDISEALVDIEQIVFPDGQSQNPIHLAAAIMSEKVPYTYMDYTLYPIYEDNEIVAFAVYNNEEEMQSSYDKKTRLLSFNSGLQDEFVSFGVQIHTYQNGVFLDIFGRENIANGYAAAALFEGVVTDVTYTIEEYLLQN